METKFPRFILVYNVLAIKNWIQFVETDDYCIEVECQVNLGSESNVEFSFSCQPLTLPEFS